MNMNNPFEVILTKLDYLTVVVEKLQTEKNEIIKKEENTILNLKEAAQLLKFKENSIYYHLNKNNLPGNKPGKEWKFSKDEIIAWALKPRAKVKNTKTKMVEIRDRYKNK